MIIVHRRESRLIAAFSPFQERPREWLGCDVSQWPKPNGYQKYGLDLRNPFIDNVQALEAALTRQDIDTLAMHNNLKRDDKVRNLIVQLLSQDLDWKVNITYGIYNWLVHDWEITAFQNVRYLEVNNCHEDLVTSLPNLKEVIIGSPDDEHGRTSVVLRLLAKKVTHVSVNLWELNDALRCPLPLAANQHLRSFTYKLDSASRKYLPEWTRQLSQLENIRYFRVKFGEDYDGGWFREGHFGHTDDSKYIQPLCSWISSPSCQLTHFEFGSSRTDCSLQPKPSLMLFEALGQNRSIQKIHICDWSKALNFSNDILPYLSKSSIHHFDFRRAHISLADWRDLVAWICQMRGTRFVTAVDMDNQCPLRSPYLCLVHDRWKKWQSTFLREQAPNRQIGDSYLITLPRWLWAQELWRLDASSGKLASHIGMLGEAKETEIEELSLDATFYVLRRWLTTISEVPLSPDPAHKECTVLK